LLRKGKKRMGEILEQDFQIIDGCLMIRLPEEIDHHSTGAVCEQADRYMLREEVRNVVFDFENTRFMDSSGIGLIVGRYKRIACFGGRVYAIHVDRQIRRIFRVSGLEKIVEVL
jgi:stage II sporulation protein AA (anti-sigma F factor antagonist)